MAKVIKKNLIKKSHNKLSIFRAIVVERVGQIKPNKARNQVSRVEEKRNLSAKKIFR